jgi:hypothetical protein
MFHAGSAIVDQVKVELVLPAEVVTVGHILERLQGSVLVSQAHFGQDVYVRFFLYPDQRYPDQRPSGRKIELEYFVELGDQALEAVTHLEGGGCGVELGVDHGPLVDDFADGLQ